MLYQKFYITIQFVTNAKNNTNKVSGTRKKIIFVDHLLTGELKTLK
jgi:hypothetical protein